MGNCCMISQKKDDKNNNQSLRNVTSGKALSYRLGMGKGLLGQINIRDFFVSIYSMPEDHLLPDDVAR